MKVLYVQTKVNQVSGGLKCHEANLNILKRIVGIENVVEYTKERFPEKESCFKRNINRLMIGKYDNFTGKDLKIIHEIIENRGIDVVFFDGSKMGLIAKNIKKRYPKIKIVTFFHNVEWVFASNYIKKLCYYQKKLAQLDLRNIHIGESNTCIYSDVIICLNNRDGNLIKTMYKRNPDYVIPICVEDSFDSSFVTPHKHKIPVGLMVGSYFGPNLSGLEWFVQNVLPHVEMKFMVVGSGMDKVKKKYKDVEKMEIYGYVDDLRKIYADSDFMIMPIFEGSGMKVKTAEALSFGKYIFAAPEAVIGYNYSDNEIMVCHDASEFIKGINDYNIEKHTDGFYKSSRDLFLREYSYQSLERRYRSLLNSIY